MTVWPSPPLADLASLLRETLAAEGRFRWPLRGRSMWPTLPTSCEIEVIAPPERLRPGLLAVTVAGDALAAHRLMRCVAGRWVTQGDGCLMPDAPLAPEQIVAVVVAAYRDGRRCWPGPAERWLARFWVVRHHALRPLAVACRAWRRLFSCRPARIITAWPDRGV